jgi:hypothetical protein
MNKYETAHKVLKRMQPRTNTGFNGLSYYTVYDGRRGYIATNKYGERKQFSAARCTREVAFLNALAFVLDE